MILTKEEILRELTSGDKSEGKWWEGNLERVGKENVYTCQLCNGYIVTIDKDPGVTPLALSHALLEKVSGIKQKCVGTLISHSYPPATIKPKFVHAATFQWVRKEFYESPSSEMKEYLLKGGLTLEPVNG